MIIMVILFSAKLSSLNLRALLSSRSGDETPQKPMKFRDQHNNEVVRDILKLQKIANHFIFFLKKRVVDLFFEGLCFLN